jgi:hypothetical protein
MAQGALGVVVGQQQVRVVEHDPEGIPVVEQLAHQRLGLVMGAVGMRQTERSQSL